MQSHVLEYLTEEDLRLYTKVCFVVEKIPNMDFGDERLARFKIKNAISCHMLARAIASFLPLRVEDGIVMGAWEHSWLVTPHGSIIDAYPPALFGAPILVDAGSASPWREFYARTCSFLHCREPDFLAKTESVKTEVAKALKRAGWLNQE